MGVVPLFRPRVIVASVLAAGALPCLWGLGFLWLSAFGGEGALPPQWRIPDVPPGVTVVRESDECGSGGCWRQLTLVPAAGSSPEELARRMGLTEERTMPPALLDPAFVTVGASPSGGTLTVYVRYR
ncbi:hypothetical protein J2S43_001205 [Catenuloplanes nepalensis]|uniref:Uncharacterized protein n=1 Tax=Catenuloplanes nepalensis TaxID=587533 RepID=A0ABT9MN20_9ACTN|nr:hypothetical protein [Catenuloplanes nepalensis]MDP9792693.1 hypothetical protein [Catenuloplanes nepalensis]